MKVKIRLARYDFVYISEGIHVWIDDLLLGRPHLSMIKIMASTLLTNPAVPAYRPSGSARFTETARPHNTPAVRP